MKKIFFYLAIFFMFWSVVTGTASITISKPSQNDLWKPGTQHDIVWTKIGTQHQKVKIRLFDSSATQKLLEITNETLNDGSYPWTVPSGYTPGTYVIRVKTLDDEVHDNSEQFEIGYQPVVDPEIDVTDPQLNAKWYKGKSYDIKWTKTGSMSNTVKITLHSQPETQPIKTISSGTSNSELFPWDIPADMSSGSYVVRVMTSDNVVFGYSKQFYIKQKFSPLEGLVPFNAKIDIIKPSTSSSWPNGKAHLIKWKSKFTKGKQLKIDLFDFSGKKFIKTIAMLPPIIVKPYGKGKTKPSETSTYNWFISGNTGPGKHRVRISRTDGVASGMSDMFMIQTEIKTTVHKVYGKVYNHCKRVYWHKHGQAALQRLAEQIDKIDCVNHSNSDAWVGYSNHMTNNQLSYYGFAWRAFVVFDLKQFQGKGVIVSAKLKYHKTYHPPGANCAISVYKVNAPYNDGFIVNMELIDNPGADMTSAAQNWLGFPNGNHGMVFVGPDESFRRDQSVCKAFLNGIYLEIEFVGKI